MSIIPGSTIGKFQLERQLGGGGMGSVYKAKDTKLNRTVAIKVLNSQYDYNSDNIERFEREARTLVSLNHPNLMHVYDVGVEDNHHYFAMEYIQGRSLSSLIRDPEYELTSQEALRITIEIMAGLRKVHNSGIIHRDIKPANIMIESTDGRAVLVDFGLSKSASDSGLTSAGSILGTPDYISPEQIEGFEAGYQSDIYSLGVVLYEMISGSNPFTRTSSMQTIRAHCSFTPPPLRKVCPKTTKEISRIVEKMLDVDPIRRYQNIAELATDMLKACQHPLLEKLAVSGAPYYPPAADPDSEILHMQSITPYKHYLAQVPTIHREFPFWRYFSAGVTVIGVLLLVFLFYNNSRRNSETFADIPAKVLKYHLPIQTYAPEDSPTPQQGITYPSVILQLKNGRQIWGKILDGISDNRITLGLYPKGQAGYPIAQIQAIIMADSEAVSEKIPDTYELLNKSLSLRQQSDSGK